MSFLQVKGLSARLKRVGHPLFRRMPLAVAAAEARGLLDESGVRKSMIGKAVLEIFPKAVKVSGWEVLLDGVELLRLPVKARRERVGAMCALIPQDPMSSLNPRHRVGQIVDAPLALHGVADPQARMAEALDQVALIRAMAGRYPHELSGGQRQRVGIVRAIALRPDFILADEIVSGLDVPSQAQVLILLERLAADLGLSRTDRIVHPRGASLRVGVRNGRAFPTGQEFNPFASGKNGKPLQFAL